MSSPSSRPTSAASGSEAPVFLLGEPPVITGSGRQTRDFVHVSDVVRANILASRLPKKIASGLPINIGSGRETRIRDLCRTILDLLSSDLEPVFLPPRPGEVLRSRADISRARKVLGWKPRVSLKDGLETAIAWYRSDPATLRLVRSARSRRSVLRTRHPLTHARS